MEDNMKYNTGLVKYFIEDKGLDNVVFKIQINNEIEGGKKGTFAIEISVENMLAHITIKKDDIVNDEFINLGKYLIDKTHYGKYIWKMRLLHVFKNEISSLSNKYEIQHTLIDDGDFIECLDDFIKIVLHIGSVTCKLK